MAETSVKNDAVSGCVVGPGGARGERPELATRNVRFWSRLCCTHRAKGTGPCCPDLEVGLATESACVGICSVPGVSFCGRGRYCQVIACLGRVISTGISCDCLQKSAGWHMRENRPPHPDRNGGWERAAGLKENLEGHFCHLPA